MLLDKGLKYAPKQNLNKFNLHVDIQKYTRKLNIKKYMLNKTVATNVDNRGLIDTPGRVTHSQLRNKSLFNPPVHNNQHIEVFNKMVTQEVDKISVRRLKDAQVIRNGIKELEKN